MPRVKKRGATIFQRLVRYGNYFGPGWSGGQWQDSIDYTTTPDAPRPRDRVDELAMYHDQAYAREMRATGKRKLDFGNENLARADLEFAPKEIKTGTVRGIIGGIAVGAQGAARYAVGALTRKRSAKQTNNLNTDMTYGSVKRFSLKGGKRARKANTSKKSNVGQHKYYGAISGTSLAVMGVKSTAQNHFLGAASDFRPDHPLYQMSLSIVRHIMRTDFTCDVTNVHNFFSSYVPLTWTGTTIATNANPFEISLLERTNGDVVTQRIKWSPTYTESVHQLCQRMSYTFQEYLKDPAFTTLVGVQVRIPHHADSGGTADSWRVTPIRFFDDMIVSMKVMTRMKFQHTTAAVTGNHSDALQVAPLVCRMYKFKDPYPEMRPNIVATTTSAAGVYGYTTETGTGGFRSWLDNGDSNNDGFYSYSNAGITTPLPAGSLPAGIGDWVPTEWFNNVVTQKTFIIKPGDIVSFVVPFTFDGTLNKLLEGMRYTREIARVNPFGQFYLFQFKKHMEWSNSVSVTYDFVRTTSCSLKKFIKRGCEIVKLYNAGENYISNNAT